MKPFGLLGDAAAFWRYIRGLPDFLRDTISLEEARRRVEKHTTARKENFLHLLKHGVFDRPGGPYRALLKNAGLGFADVADLVNREGVEGALNQMYRSGVYLTLDEFKGRRPVVRGGLRLSVEASDFDNPLLARHYDASTGASRGAGTRLLIDFDLLEHEACSHALHVQAFGLADRPAGLWRPVPPGVAGLKNTLRHMKLGSRVERWFSQNRNVPDPRALKYFVFTNTVLVASRLAGRPLPVPRHVPLAEAWKVARWLAEKSEAGTPAYLDTTASAGVRVCLAAREHGLDIAGTFFRLGGEPFTPAKARVVADAGSRAVCHYSMGETGHIGIACADGAHVDDVHLLPAKMALIQREITADKSGRKVSALIHTTLFPGCPKIMINVQSGDYGVLERRSCGCPLDSLGMRQHLHTIRSYEKMTSEGMCFIGSELLELIEEVLPQTFGGHPTDYQFVEQEENGRPRVSIVVSPRVGPLEEARLKSVVLKSLGSASRAHALMAGLWEDGQVLRVVHSEVFSSQAGKILPLHVSL
jgi:hypothetical protein